MSVLVSPIGKLFEEAVLLDHFDSDQLQCINKLRYELRESFPNLREKINTSSKYFGFGINDSKDRFYIYLQARRMVLDIDIPYTRKEELIQSGMLIVERNNFQARSGWITGIRMNYDCSDFNAIKSLVIEALENV